MVFRRMIHNFGDSNKVGQEGEKLFLKAFDNLESHPKGITGPDFVDTDTGDLIELKTDTYDLSTGNFFLEKYSDVIQKTPGGLYQALEKGSDVFVYFYINSPKKSYFIFPDLKAAIARLDEIVDKKNIELSKIRNNGYVTAGYKIPRIYMRQFFVEKFLDVK